MDPTTPEAATEENCARTRAAIVDPCPARAHGIAAALSQDDFETAVVQDYGNTLVSVRPDVVVVASRDAGEVEGVAKEVSALCGSDVTLVALLPDDSATTFRSALRGGVTGAVQEDADLDRIRECVRLALRRRTVLPTDVAHRLANGRTGSAGPVLSTTEAAWLQGLADGRTVGELASAWAFSERELHRQLRALYFRIGASNRVRALLWAMQEGVIT
jgi:DNA-binding NarL/FixJ family response regulator